MAKENHSTSELVYLDVLPILGQRMSDSTFIKAIKFRLGLVQHAGTGNCGVCRHAHNDCFGNHALTCVTSGDRIIRHDLLAKEVHRSCRSALFTAQLEQRNLMEGAYRPGDRELVQRSCQQRSTSQLRIQLHLLTTRQPRRRTMLRPQSVRLARSRNMKKQWL
jgi:hypothetical protein